MPRFTKQYEVMTFDELSDEAKEVAREWFRKGIWEDGWLTESISDQMKEMAKDKGLPGAELEWDLGGSSYNYARINSASVSEDVVLQGMGFGEDPRIKIFDVGLSLGQNEGSQVYLEYAYGSEGQELSEEQEEQFESELQEAFTQYVKEVEAELLQMAEAEEKYQFSEEQVDEAIHANEYTFDEEGNRKN